MRQLKTEQQQQSIKNKYRYLNLLKHIRLSNGIIKSKSKKIRKQCINAHMKGGTIIDFFKIKLVLYEARKIHRKINKAALPLELIYDQGAAIYTVFKSITDEIIKEYNNLLDFKQIREINHIRLINNLKTNTKKDENITIEENIKVVNKQIKDTIIRIGVSYSDGERELKAITKFKDKMFIYRERLFKAIDASSDKLTKRQAKINSEVKLAMALQGKNVDKEKTRIQLKVKYYENDYNEITKLNAEFLNTRTEKLNELNAFEQKVDKLLYYYNETLIKTYSNNDKVLAEWRIKVRKFYDYLNIIVKRMDGGLQKFKADLGGIIKLSELLVDSYNKTGNKTVKENYVSQFDKYIKLFKELSDTGLSKIITYFGNVYNEYFEQNIVIKLSKISEIVNLAFDAFNRILNYVRDYYFFFVFHKDTRWNSELKQIFTNKEKITETTAMEIIEKDNAPPKLQAGGAGDLDSENEARSKHVIFDTKLKEAVEKFTDKDDEGFKKEFDSAINMIFKLDMYAKFNRGEINFMKFYGNKDDKEPCYSGIGYFKRNNDTEKIYSYYKYNFRLEIFELQDDIKIDISDILTTEEEVRKPHLICLDSKAAIPQIEGIENIALLYPGFEIKHDTEWQSISIEEPDRNIMFFCVQLSPNSLSGSARDDKVLMLDPYSGMPVITTKTQIALLTFESLLNTFVNLKIPNNTWIEKLSNTLFGAALKRIQYSHRKLSNLVSKAYIEDDNDRKFVKFSKDKYKDVKQKKITIAKANINVECSKQDFYKKVKNIEDEDEEALAKKLKEKEKQDELDEIARKKEPLSTSQIRDFVLKENIKYMDMMLLTPNLHISISADLKFTEIKSITDLENEIRKKIAAILKSTQIEAKIEKKDVKLVSRLSQKIKSPSDVKDTDKLQKQEEKEEGYYEETLKVPVFELKEAEKIPKTLIDVFNAFQYVIKDITQLEGKFSEYKEISIITTKALDWDLSKSKEQRLERQVPLLQDEEDIRKFAAETPKLEGETESKGTVNPEMEEILLKFLTAYTSENDSRAAAFELRTNEDFKDLYDYMLKHNDSDFIEFVRKNFTAPGNKYGKLNRLFSIFLYYAIPKPDKEKIDEQQKTYNMKDYKPKNEIEKNEKERFDAFYNFYGEGKKIEEEKKKKNKDQQDYKPRPFQNTPGTTPGAPPGAPPGVPPGAPRAPAPTGLGRPGAPIKGGNINKHTRKLRTIISSTSHQKNSKKR